MADFKFSPTKISEAVEKKLAVERLPSWAQGTEQIQKYFDDAIQQWFTPEQQKTIDGYVGARGGSNSAGKTYIEEITRDRTEYQLQPAMVSTTATNEVQTMLTYPDLVDYLGHIGCLNENESRLLSGRTYSWAPPINPDMIMNYSNYYWDTTNEEGMTRPDYIVMERGARDGNTWSVSNHWYPANYVDENGFEINITTDDISNGRYIQAKRPIIEYKKDLQLFNYGRNSRGTVDLVADIVRPEQIVHRSIFDGVRIDGEVLQDGDRILFTGITNAGENNRVYKVVFETRGNKEVYGLHLDTDEQTDERPSGEPKEYDTIRCLRGTDFGGHVLQWTGSRWEDTQFKSTTNQIPLFNLFDKNGVVLNDPVIYPRSDFAGSPVFAVKIDFTEPRDTIYNLNIKKDQYGSISYENHIQSDTFTYISRNERVELTGAKFYAINQENPADDAFYSDWLESDIPSRQYVTQTIEPTTYIINEETGETAYHTEYELAINLGTNPDGVNYPLVRVDISGEILTADEYEINGKTIEIKRALDEESMIGVYIFNEHETPNRELGVYELPSNLKHNANNTVIEDIDETRLADHFYDIIQSQENFQGSVVGVNNYYSSKRDLSVGRRIVQHDASLLPLMLHASSERLDIQKAVDFVKVAYNNFKSKFLNRLEDISNDGFGSLTASQVVATILEQINIGKSDEFAFWLSGLGASTVTARPFIAPTPQYLGMIKATQPELRKKMYIDGVLGVYNRSHTGAYSRAFSTLDPAGNVITDFRDDVIYHMEYLMYQSIPLKFRSEDYVPALHKFDVKPGAFRTTDYTLDEWKRIELRSFEQWAIANSVDYVTNTKFDQNNWQTWNYTGTLFRIDGTPVNGSLKAIYDYYFDTERPHTHPWEILGFTSKPVWWDDEYITDGGIDDAIIGAIYLESGEKSYNNEMMLDDIAEGRIRAGEREGVYPELARPGIKDYWPIDETTGELRKPWESNVGATVGAASLIDREPGLGEREVDWRFGDMGHVEYGYKNSNYYAFDESMMLFRAKPAQWTNYFWDTENYSLVSQEGGQTHWLHDDKERRLYLDRLETLVHGEENNRIIGYQMWVADYLKHNHINIQTNYGDIIRGAGVKLCYRLGGFSKNENLTFVSDNFGLVSQENQQLHLLKSQVRRQEVLSGVTVRYDGKHYVLSGFDSSNPRFEYFKPVKTGKKSSVRIGNRSVVLHQVFDQRNPAEVTYDTKFKSIQDVFDFFIGYGKLLEARGWIFEDQVDGEVFDWRFMAAGFIDWVQGARVAGDFITLSPASKTVKFATDHGNIDSVAQFSGGAWTLVDANNSGIGTHEINVSRIGNIMSIRVNEDVDKRVMLSRININEYEHVVVFDNTTIFNDLMYLPDYGLHQPRLRVYGNISDAWNGRLEAPGFMIVDDTTLPNFEKLVNDFKKYYDNENPGSSVELNDLARHAIGFQSREWLRRLILNDRSQVDFYKGYIKEKGTVQSFDNILRTSKELNTPNYKVIEEWAFLSGEYGDVANQQYMEFLVQSNELRQNPQYCVFDENLTEDVDYDDVITFFGKQGVDPRWITRSVTTKFPMIEREFKSNLPNFGPVTLNEVTTVVQDVLDLRTNREDGFVPVKTGERVWMLDKNGTWDILELHTTGLKATKAEEVDGLSTITFNGSISQLQDGDIWFVFAPNNQHTEFTSEAYFQTVIDGNELLSPVSVDKVFDNDQPELYYWRSIFANSAQKEVYINSRKIGVVDIARFERPVIYNRATNQTETYLTLWDPIEGVVPGIAEAEIDFKMRRDPALYNNIDKDAQAWGRDQVGMVWWDTTNAKYIDYKQAPRDKDGNELDFDTTINYRRNNWGKMLPGSSIDVYEWVRSPVAPVNWEEYVEKQAALNKATNVWTPSGEALLDDWCENSEFDVNSNEFKTYYYFWVKGCYTVPNVTGRERTVSEIARIIDDPSTLNIPWFAPVTDDAYIVSGINSIITDDQSVLQLSYKTNASDGNIHKQWRLFQEGNDYYFDDDMWATMIDSLVGETELPRLNENDEPTYAPVIYPSAQLGNTQGKTWFKSIPLARKEFIAACNQYFESVNISGDLTTMTDVFNYEETAINPYVRDFEIVEHEGVYVLRILNAERFRDYDPVILSTNGVLPKNGDTTTELSNSQVYFVQRVTGEEELFYLNSSAAPNSFITIADKGNGQHTILRSADATATLANALNMKDYWEYVDWYEEGFGVDTPFTDVANLTEADTMNFILGDVVRVFSDEETWTLYTKDFSRDVPIWRTVGRYRSTIKLNDRLATDAIYDDNGELTEQELINRRAIRLLATSFGESQSRVVFPMVYYVHHEQQVVDWVFKTSYVTILGIDRTLDNTIVTHNDAISDVLEYINEVKPYRTKIRTSILQRTSDKDTITGKAWDTDSNQIEADEAFVDHQQAYIDEWAKPEASRDFSHVRTNFRQSQEVVFFDQVAAEPDLNLISDIQVPELAAGITSNVDQTNVLPAELEVDGFLVNDYNGLYFEILDSNLMPVPAGTFSIYSSANSVLLDRISGAYCKKLTGKTIFIWKMVGFGWIISQDTAEGKDWFYEDTSANGGISADKPHNVQRWTNANKQLGYKRGTSATSGFVTQLLDTRERKDRSMYIDRFKRSFQTISVATLDRLYAAIIARDIEVSEDEWYQAIPEFVTPATDDSMFNIYKFFDVMKDFKFNITADEVNEIVNEAIIDLRYEQQVLNTANRIRIYNPDADQAYIDQIMKSDFKGCQVHNQPNLRGPIGYGPASYDDTFGYYQWSDDLYQKLLTEFMVDEGLSLPDAQDKLQTLGFVEAVDKIFIVVDDEDEVDENGLPVQLNVQLDVRGAYIKSSDLQRHTEIIEEIRALKEVDPTDPQINVLEKEARQQRDLLNDMMIDPENPLSTKSLEEIDGFVNDVANYDNFGYDRVTRSVLHEEIDEGTYLFDISELDMEADDFSNFTATITSYRPDKFEPIDYGKYQPDGTSVTDQVNAVVVDYKTFDHFDIRLLTWDFGKGYGKAIAYREGSFSLEAIVMKDPRNPDRIIVSAPRSGTVNILSNNWDRDMDGLYTDNNQYVYNFTFESRPAGTVARLPQVGQLEIGRHSFVDGDEVVLFAQDDDLIPNASVNDVNYDVDWNDVESRYKVRVINSTTIALLDQNDRVIEFDTNDTELEKVQHGTLHDYDTLKDTPEEIVMGQQIVFSLMHILPAKALCDIRIDTLNYQEIYGRFMSGGELFEPLEFINQPDTFAVSGHGLTTGEAVIFSSHERNLDTGDVILGTPYYASVAGDFIQLSTTIEGAIAGTDIVNVGTDINKCTMTPVNYWITSTLTTLRRDIDWHDYQDDIVNILDDQDYDFIIDTAIDRINAPYAYTEVVDQGFNRPTIDAGSLRELVRSNTQEQLSITVFQDERGLNAAVSSQVKDKNDVLMYNKNGTTQYAFRMTLSPDNQVMEIKRLSNDATATLVTDLLYNSEEFEVNGNVPESGTLEVNGEFIQYTERELLVSGNYMVRGFTRGNRYTHEGRRHEAGTTCVVMSGSGQDVPRVLAGDTLVSATISDPENYSHSSTFMFDTTINGNGDREFLPLASVDNEFTQSLKERLASFGVITGI